MKTNKEERLAPGEASSVPWKSKAAQPIQGCPVLRRMAADERVAETPFASFDTAREIVLEFGVADYAEGEVIPPEAMFRIDEERDAFCRADAPLMNCLAIRLCGDLDVAGN